jgi:hypothetical protein
MHMHYGLWSATDCVVDGALTHRRRARAAGMQDCVYTSGITLYSVSTSDRDCPPTHPPTSRHAHAHKRCVTYKLSAQRPPPEHANLTV